MDVVIGLVLFLVIGTMIVRVASWIPWWVWLLILVCVIYATSR